MPQEAGELIASICARSVVGKWQLANCPPSTLPRCTDGELLGPADRAEHARILLILQFALANPSAVLGAGDNELDTKLAEHLGETRPGTAVAVVLDAL